MTMSYTRDTWNNLKVRLNNLNIATLAYIQGYPLEWETDLQQIDFAKMPYTFPDLGQMKIKYIKLRNLIGITNNYHWISPENTGSYIDELTNDRKYIEIIKYLAKAGKIAPPLLQIYYTDNGMGENTPIGATILDGSHRAKLAVWKAHSLEQAIPVIITTITHKQQYPIIKNMEADCINHPRHTPQTYK